MPKFGGGLGSVPAALISSSAMEKGVPPWASHPLVALISFRRASRRRKVGTLTSVDFCFPTLLMSDSEWPSRRLMNDREVSSRAWRPASS